MQLEATGRPIRYRLRSGIEILIRPGVPAEVPDPAARELLAKAPGKVRAVNQSTDTITVEAVGSLSPVYWASDGRISALASCPVWRNALR